MMLLTSKELFEKLKEFEGLRLEAYKDVAGVWTIGYGHTYNVREGDRISEYWAEEMLRKDIEMCERQVLALGVVKYQGQLDALVEFTFNLGIGRLKTSTLLRDIQNNFGRETIGKEFRRWTYVNGKRMNALIRRRSWDVQRYFDDRYTLEDVKEMLAEKQKNASHE